MIKIHIRPASQDDLKSIYNLVKELAVYEKAGDQVTATFEDYKKDFESGWFESIVAVFENEVVGMMLYYDTYSTWKGKMLYLEDFVVKESYRKKGVGQMLFNSFMKIAEQKEARLAKWQVLDWNIPAIKFYEKNRTIIEKNWWNVKIFLPQMLDFQ